jgi:hypothetical protein
MFLGRCGSPFGALKQAVLTLIEVLLALKRGSLALKRA